MKSLTPAEDRDKRAPERAAREAKRAFDGLSKFCEVLLPGEAEEPILHPALANAIHAWLREIRAKDALKAVNVKPRSTALFFGPPGTGKTTMAHHISARLGMPLCSVKTESILGMYLGEAEKNMAALFDALGQAKGQVVCLFDEIDAIGAKRDNLGGSSAGEARISTLNVMLKRIEQFDGICIGATNRRDALDPALWRRFGMQIEMGLPGDVERFAIIKRYLLPFDMEDDEIDILVDLTEGASPSLLRQLIEGVKRTIVLAPAGAATNPAKVFEEIVASVAPAPDLPVPVLWQKAAGGLDDIAKIRWPLERSGK